MTWGDVIQIILIPIFTILLAGLLEKNKEIRLRNITKDKEKFEVIYQLFVQENSLYDFFRDQSVADDIRHNTITQIEKVCRKLEEPGFIFTNKKLEILRVQLNETIREFLNQTARNFTIHESNNTSYRLTQKSIFYESGSRKDEDNMIELIHQIDKTGTEVFEIYKQLSELAQKTL